MIELLEKAFAEASKLSEEEQQLLATLILEELASERQWDQVFSDSAEALDQLADEALSEHREGRTQKLNANRL